jgi:DNA (cytosine-5)-methyltransferase 1
MISPTHTRKNHVTVRKAIGYLPGIEAEQRSDEDPLHCASKLTGINMKRINLSLPGGTWRDWDDSLKLSCHKKETGKSYSSIYGRMSWENQLPPFQFYGYGNGRFGHPEQNRALSIREGAVLQSFPHDYEFLPPGKSISKKELGMHIGNVVPVKELQ